MKRVLVVSALALAFPSAIASAQQVHAGAVEFIAGTVMFADDGVVTEGMIGAAGRYYVSPRIALGPEIVFVQGKSHSHLIATGNVTFDFIPQSGSRRPPIIPFAVIGGGMFQTRDRAPRGGFTSSEGAFTAGGGVRGFVNERLLVGAEARVGWELHIRFNGIVAWIF